MPPVGSGFLSKWMEISKRVSMAVSSPEHLANPFLNILNATSKSASQYPDLLGKRSLLWRFGHSLAGALVMLARSVLYWPRAIRLDDQPGKPDVIIISHLTHPRHLEETADFYFGSLAEIIEAGGWRTHTVLINHARVGNQASSRGGVSVLPAFLSPLGELGLILRLMAAAFSLPCPKPDKPGTNKDERRFQRLARLAQFGNIAIGDYRIGTMLARMINKTSPMAIIHTYEGHGWERIVATTAHSLAEPATVLGYQHAVIFPGEKSILDERGIASPDHIFTTGESTHAILTRDSAIPAERFSILGSIKASTPGNTARANKVNFRADGACLIAPEGTMGEVMLMAGFAIETARNNPDQGFILRLHPVMPRREVERKLAGFGPLPANFMLSDASLDDDLLRSSWLCYRGSTVALQGILAGLRPIYLNPDDSARTNDPIPDDLAFRRVASSWQGLAVILNADRQNPGGGQAELKDALRFARDYLMPYQPEAVVKTLKAFQDKATQ